MSTQVRDASNNIIDFKTFPSTSGGLVAGFVMVDNSGNPNGNTTPLYITGNTQESAVQGVLYITPGTTVRAGRLLLVNCTVAGNVVLTFVDNSVLVYPVSIGVSLLPFAIIKVGDSGAGTNAVATYANLL